jgi:hypothetical protein
VALRRRLGLVVTAALIALLGAHVAPAPAQTVRQQIDAAHTGVTAGAALAPPLRERWRRVFDASVPISHTVANALVADGRVFVTSQPSGGAAALHALDPADDRVAGARTDLAPEQGAGYGSGRVLVSTDSTLYALSAATGAVLWSRSQWPGRDGSGLDAGAVVADGTAYVGVAGYGSGIYALDVTDGSVGWWRDMSAAGGVAVAADRVFVNDVSALVALRRSDGRELWRHTPERTFFRGHPAVRDGRVYVPSLHDGVVLDASPPIALRARRISAVWRAGAVTGAVRAEPGAGACVRRVRVLLERRRGGRWRRIARGITTRRGRFRLSALRRDGRHRVRAPALVLRPAGAPPVRCRGASRRVG